MLETPCLDLQDAKAIIDAGKAHAAGIGVPSTLCVMDPSGVVIAQERMDGATLSSVILACDKAFTAASLGMATGEIGPIAAPGGPFYGISNGLNGRAIVFPGGLPIRAEGQLVGAVGSSGGSGEQDLTVAQAAAAAFKGADR